VIFLQWAIGIDANWLSKQKVNQTWYKGAKKIKVSLKV